MEKEFFCERTKVGLLLVGEKSPSLFFCGNRSFHRGRKKALRLLPALEALAAMVLSCPGTAYPTKTGGRK